VALGLALCTVAGAADDGSALQKALVDDSQVLLHLRSYYFDRQPPGPVESAAWAAGGWLAYSSGWLDGWLRVGAGGLHLAADLGAG